MKTKEKTLEKLPLFWDVKDLDPAENSNFVIKRILEFGDVEDIKWAADTYGENKIKEVFLKSRPLSKKSDNFWCNFFNIDSQICKKRQSIIKQRVF